MYSDLPLFQQPTSIRAVVMCPRCHYTYGQSAGSEITCSCGLRWELIETNGGGFIARLVGDWEGVKPIPQIVGWME